MSRFPGSQFPNSFGLPPNGGGPFIPPRQLQRLPFPYHHGRPQMQQYPSPSHFRPASPGLHTNNYHYRPHFVPRGEQRPRFQGKSQQGKKDVSNSIVAYYKHSMVENPWSDLEEKIKESLDQ